MSFGRELQDFVGAFSATNRLGLAWDELQNKKDDLTERREHNRATDARDLVRSQQLRQGDAPIWTSPAFKGSAGAGASDTGASGTRMSLDQVRPIISTAVKNQGFEGVVPADGAKYGIKTGSNAEWTNLWTRLAYHESGFDNGNVGDADRFQGGSRGQLQLSYADAPAYGLNGGKPFTAEQLADPTTNVNSALAIGKTLLEKHGGIEAGLGKYWGPISKEGWTPGAGRDAALSMSAGQAIDATMPQEAQAFADGGLVEEEDQPDPEQAVPLPRPRPDDQPEPETYPTPTPRPAPAVATQPESALPAGTRMVDGKPMVQRQTAQGQTYWTPYGNADAPVGGSGTSDHFAALPAALDGGIRFLQDHFGLSAGRATEQAIPSDPQRRAIDDGWKRLMAGEGAASEAEAEAIRKAVDPKLSLDDSVANIAGLSRVYEFYMMKGDEKGARRAAASLMQYTRLKSMQLGQAALSAKTPEEAAKLVQQGYNQVPDGKHVEVDIGPNGTGTIKQIDTRTGKVVLQGQYGPEQLIGAAKGLANGSAYWQMVMKSAGEAQTKPETDAESDDYIRSIGGGGQQAIPAPAPTAAPAQQQTMPAPEYGSRDTAPLPDSVAAPPIAAPAQQAIPTNPTPVTAATAGVGPEPQPPSAERLAKMTPQGRQQALAIFKFEHEQWEGRRDAANPGDTGADEYVRQVESTGPNGDADPEPQPPKLSTIKTKEGLQKAVSAYKIAKEQWEKRQEAKAPAAPPKLSERESASKEVEGAWDAWEASRTPATADGTAPDPTKVDPIDPQGKQIRKELAKHLIIANGDMAAVDAIDASDALLAVDATNPTANPWVAAKPTKDGRRELQLRDGRTIIIDRTAAGFLQRARSKLAADMTAKADKRNAAAKRTSASLSALGVIPSTGSDEEKIKELSEQNFREGMAW